MSFQVRGNNSSSSTQNRKLPPLKLLDCTLRVSAIPLGITSIWLTVTDRQSNETYGDIEFKNFLGLKYMVLISAICIAYAFASAVSSWLHFLATKAWIFFLSDQVVAYLMLTSAVAVSEILYLAYNGDRAVTWSEACASFGKFCSRMEIGLIFHGLALCCFLCLSMISAFRAFSMFDPPYVFNKDQEAEASTRDDD